MLQGKDKEHFEPRKNETNNWKYAQLSPYNVFLRKKNVQEKKVNWRLTCPRNKYTVSWDPFFSRCIWITKFL